jgi:hypothetical protein
MSRRLSSRITAVSPSTTMFGPHMPLAIQLLRLLKASLAGYPRKVAEQIYLQPFRKTKLHRELYVNLLDVPNFFFFLNPAQSKGLYKHHLLSV